MQIKITNVPKALRGLAAAKLQTLDMKPFWNKASIIIEQSEAKTFKVGGRPKWKPSKRALAQHGQTLQDTNRLMQSVTARGPNAARIMKPRALIFGTRMKYAKAMQFGYAKDNIPKRPFLGIYREDIKYMGEVLSKDLNKRIQEAIR